MATNAWTPRRWHLPRPAVCKSYPRATNPQLPTHGLRGTFVWSAVITGQPTSFTGTPDFTGPVGGDTWTFAGNDDQGNALQLVVIIPPNPAPAQLFLQVDFTLGGVWIFNGSVAGYAGSLPFTTDVGDITDLFGTVVGSWFAVLYGPAPL